MHSDPLDPRLEKALKEVKLKEPRPEQMTNYLSQVRSKIELKESQTHFRFVPAAAVAVAVVLALLGLVYLIMNQPKQKNEIPTMPAISKKINQPVSRQSLSLEEEMAILEAFSEEYPTGTSDLFGDEGIMDDLVLIDEIEFTVTA